MSWDTFCVFFKSLFWAKFNTHMCIFILQHLHAVHRCGLLLQMLYIPWSLCVCVCMSWAHEWAVHNGWTDWDAVWGATHASPRNHVWWGPDTPMGMDTCEGDMCQPVIMYLPHACPAHAADECIRRREGWLDSDAAFCQITSNIC